jgi:hypothetical protein
LSDGCWQRSRDALLLDRVIGIRNCIVALAILSLAGCQKKDGEAVVIAKEHIAAAPAQTKTAGNSTPTAGPSEGQTREMTKDEIAVDGYVMKREDRGSPRDPRALPEEQWVIKVRLIGVGRTFNVPADKRQFERFKEGDQVHVRYSVGKYTDTVWAAEITE